MIERTSALALRIHPFSETSQVVSWLTPEHGKVLTLMKGALRPKSPFLGQCDLFYTCELIFYHRTQTDLGIVRECTPLAMRPRLRKDWRAFLCASAIGALALRASMMGHDEGPLYSLITQCLDTLALQGGGELLLFWFELRYAGLLGLSLQLNCCAVCRKQFGPVGPHAFSPERGGTLCDTCSSDPSRISPISPDCLAILRRLQKSPTAAPVFSLRCTKQQLLVIREVLGTFLRFHLGMPLEGRRMALDLLHG